MEDLHKLKSIDIFDSNSLATESIKLDKKRTSHVFNYKKELLNLIKTFDPILPGENWSNINNNWVKKLDEWKLSESTHSKYYRAELTKILIEGDRNHPDRPIGMNFNLQLNSMHRFYSQYFDEKFADRMSTWVKNGIQFSNKETIPTINQITNTLKIFNQDFQITEREGFIMDAIKQFDFDIDIDLSVQEPPNLNIQTKRGYIAFFNYLLNRVYDQGIDLINIINLIHFYFREKQIILFTPIPMDDAPQGLEVLKNNIISPEWLNMDQIKNNDYGNPDNYQTQLMKRNLKKNNTLQIQYNYINYVNEKLYFGLDLKNQKHIYPNSEPESGSNYTNEDIVEILKNLYTLNKKEILPIEIKIIYESSNTKNLFKSNSVYEENIDTLPTLRFNLFIRNTADEIRNVAKALPDKFSTKKSSTTDKIEYLAKLTEKIKTNPDSEVKSEMSELLDDIDIELNPFLQKREKYEVKQVEKLKIYEYFLPILKVLTDLSQYTKKPYNINSAKLDKTIIKNIVKEYIEGLHGLEVINNSNYNAHYNLAIACLRNSGFIDKNKIELIETGIKNLLKFIEDPSNNSLEITHINNRTKYFINNKDGYKSEKGTMRNTNQKAMINQITYWAARYTKLYDYISFEHKQAKDIINEQEYMMNINLSLQYLEKMTDEQSKF